MCCCMCSLVEILCLLEEKFGLVCLQLPHVLHATETFDVLEMNSLTLKKVLTFFSEIFP